MSLTSLVHGGHRGHYARVRELVEVDVARMMHRLLEAMNAHDLDAFVACFAPDYVSEQPAHPSRAFRGSEQVRKNWEGVFAGVADFSAELVLCSIADDGVEIGEWRWRGTHADGALFAMDGVIVVGVAGDRIAWGRLYMEPVERDGQDIDQMVEDTYRPNR